MGIPTAQSIAKPKSIWASSIAKDESAHPRQSVPSTMTFRVWLKALSFLMASTTWREIEDISTLGALMTPLNSPVTACAGIGIALENVVILTPLQSCCSVTVAAATQPTSTSLDTTYSGWLTGLA